MASNGRKVLHRKRQRCRERRTFGRFAIATSTYSSPPTRHTRATTSSATSSRVRTTFEFELRDYPVTSDDILHRGRSMERGAQHRQHRQVQPRLGLDRDLPRTPSTSHRARAQSHPLRMRVTDFSHVRQMFVDAYCRLVAMKLFALRAADYMRWRSTKTAATALQPMVKMKVTTQGEESSSTVDAIARRASSAICISVSGRRHRASPSSKAPYT